MADTPTAVSETTFSVAGMTVRCYVLDDGIRLVHAEDFEALMEVLCGGTLTTDQASVAKLEAELEVLRRWQQGTAVH